VKGKGSFETRSVCWGVLISAMVKVILEVQTEETKKFSQAAESWQ
jgi:hypothetical protein